MNPKNKIRRNVRLTPVLSVLLAFLLLLPLTGCAFAGTEAWTEDPTATQIGLAPEDGEAPTAEPAEDASDPLPIVKVRMVGDMLLHPEVQQSGKTADGSYNYDHLFSQVRDEIAEADIALVNEEVILGGASLGLSGYPRFNGPFEVADAIEKAGFNVVLHATNHSMDKGEAGLRACLKNWRDNHPSVAIAGMYDSREASETLCIVEKNGIRVAILNYTYSLNGLPLPSGMPYAVRLLDENVIRSDMARAKKEADFIIVCPHWGTEYSQEPSASERKWCKLFLECGADAVIGTHPHVIQPVEWAQNGDGERAIIYWSLGNFVNSTGESGVGKRARMLGGMASFTIEKTDDGRVVITDASAVGLVTQILSGAQGITTYPFYAYTEELAKENEGVLKRDRTFSYQYCKEAFETYFGIFLR